MRKINWPKIGEDFGISAVVLFFLGAQEGFAVSEFRFGIFFDFDLKKIAYREI